MTAPVTPPISDRLEFISRRLKTLAAVCENCEQYSILPIRRDRLIYAVSEGEHQLRLLAALIEELHDLRDPKSQKEEAPPCPENASTTALPEDPGKHSAPASSGAPPPQGTSYSMFKE